MRYVEATGEAGARLEWQGPDQPRQVVPTGALLTADGAPGLRATYRRQIQSCGLEREQGRGWLRELGVRYVVTGEAGLDCLSRELQLPQIWDAEGVRIYEVPR